MPDVRAAPVVPLRGRATVIPTVGLPPVAGPTEVKHRRARRPAAAHRAPRQGSGHRPCPPRRRRRVRRRRGVTGETDPAAWEEGGARPGVRRSRAHTTPDAGATGAFLAGQPVRSLADAPIAGSRTAASRAFLAPPRPAAARRPRIRCLPRRAATAASRPAGAGPAPGAAARAAGGPIPVQARAQVRGPAQAQARGPAQAPVQAQARVRVPARCRRHRHPRPLRVVWPSIPCGLIVTSPPATTGLGSMDIRLAMVPWASTGAAGTSKYIEASAARIVALIFSFSLPRTLDRPRDALPVRRTAGPVARAGPEDSRLMNRKPARWAGTRLT